MNRSSIDRKAEAVKDAYSHGWTDMRRKDPKRLEAIAEAALACFSVAGYARTQMNDVAKRAGTSAGTLYLYVRGKTALLQTEAQPGQGSVEPSSAWERSRSKTCSHGPE